MRTMRKHKEAISRLRGLPCGEMVQIAARPDSMEKCWQSLSQWLAAEEAKA